MDDDKIKLRVFLRLGYSINTLHWFKRFKSCGK